MPVSMTPMILDFTNPAVAPGLPPQFPEARQIRTRVVLQFTDAEYGHTKVTLTHLGWGEAQLWDPVYDYFDAAWSRVLENLQKHFDQ